MSCYESCFLSSPQHSVKSADKNYTHFWAKTWKQFSICFNGRKRAPQAALSLFTFLQLFPWDVPGPASGHGLFPKVPSLAVVLRAVLSGSLPFLRQMSWTHFRALSPASCWWEVAKDCNSPETPFSCMYFCVYINETSKILYNLQLSVCYLSILTTENILCMSQKRSDLHVLCAFKLNALTR